MADLRRKGRLHGAWTWPVVSVRKHGRSIVCITQPGSTGLGGRWRPVVVLGVEASSGEPCGEVLIENEHVRLRKTTHTSQVARLDFPRGIKGGLESAMEGR
jgi:hypothetical protein